MTQVVVAKNDPAFQNPTKPIGTFYSEEEAKKLMAVAVMGYIMKEDAGRGWRRVVAAPIPRKIVKLDSVKRLWDTTIVITVCGGGIPVIEHFDGSRKGLHQLQQPNFHLALTDVHLASPNATLRTGTHPHIARPRS